MPELPEVQTIACGLALELTGRRFLSVDVRRRASVAGDIDLLRERLPGSVLRRVRRRGKALLLDLDPGLTLAFHLRMTGRLYLPEPGEEPDKHTHLVFGLEPWPGSPDRLFFRDARTFGHCLPLLPGHEAAWPFFASLGPEPLELDQEGFCALFQGRKGRIKALLLNQRVIAGIGNIYADESLFRAGIRPDAQASALGHGRLAGLHAAVQAVLEEAIAACGSSISDYRDARGNAGAFQNQFRAYGRAGERCVACGRKLTAMKVAGRTSTFCPGCQKP